MLISIPTQAILSSEELKNYKDSLYFEGIFPIRELSPKGLVTFEVSQLDQGALPLLMQIPAGLNIKGYKFYSELPLDKLDEPVPVSFPNCWKDEEKTILKTLREYHAQFIKIKKDKCLLRIGEGLGNGTHSSKTSYNFEILKAWVSEYDSTCSKIYTSKEAIAEIEASYNMPILTDDEIDEMLKSELIAFIEEWNLSIDTSLLKSELVELLKLEMGA